MGYSLPRSWQHRARLAAMIGWVAACAAITDTAHAGVREAVKANGRARYPSSMYVPLYPGANDLVLIGPGVDGASALSFPPGIASRVTFLSRHAGPSEGTLRLQVEIKPTVRGKMTARLEYPGQGTPPDAIKARVFSKGVVDRISMTSQRTVVGEAHRVRFIGSGLGVPAMRDALGVYRAVRVEGDETQVGFDVTFHRCGMLWLDASKLHDEHVPVSEVVEGLAAYTGAATQVIVVGPRPGEECPQITGNDRVIKFCAPGQNWDPAHERCIRR